MASTSDQPERPLMRYGSYVEKGGYLNRKSRFGLPKKNRYLRLTGSTFQVWLSEEKFLERKESPELEIGLQNCRVVGSEQGLEISVVAAHRTETFVAHTHEDYRDWLSALLDASEKSIKDYYGFVKVLGEGRFGRVVRAKDHRTGEYFAVKIIRKNKNELRSATLIEREMDILRLVNHKNIVRLYDLFDTENKLFFVLEYMRGGVLFEVVSKRDIHFSEEVASKVLRDLLQGLQYLHSLGIVHRDIKPENILTTSKEWPFTSKLADFGLSNFLAAHTGVLDSKVGTPYYCAREVVVNDNYSEKADLWSVGVLAYEMLSGIKPFEGNDSVSVLLAIRDGVYRFPHEHWFHISAEARDFVQRLICIDVNRRMSATEALQHTWIVNEGRNEAIRNDLSALARPASRGLPGMHREDDDMDIE